eukprot:jgi/Antlo1/639/2494
MVQSRRKYNVKCFAGLKSSFGLTMYALRQNMRIICCFADSPCFGFEMC